MPDNQATLSIGKPLGLFFRISEPLNIGIFNKFVMKATKINPSIYCRYKAQKSFVYYLKSSTTDVF